MNRIVTLKGKSLSLSGPELRIGDEAPSATMRKDLFTDFSLDEVKNKARIYSVVPSLDTPVCALQTCRFNKEAAQTSDLLWFTISCDLPMAMHRFCGSENIDTEKIDVLSDHKNLEFGNQFGTLIPELRILCRAVFVIDSADILRHVEYVAEISNEPNYQAVLATLAEL